MTSSQSDSKKTSSFKMLDMGSLEKWRHYVFENPKVPTTQGKCFLKETMNLTGMEVSLNVLAPGEGIPFYHKHRENEELYIFIKGKGQFQVDGEVFDVVEGSVGTGIIPTKTPTSSSSRRKREAIQGRTSLTEGVLGCPWNGEKFDFFKSWKLTNILKFSIIHVRRQP